MQDRERYQQEHQRTSKVLIALIGNGLQGSWLVVQYEKLEVAIEGGFRREGELWLRRQSLSVPDLPA